MRKIDRVIPCHIFCCIKIKQVRKKWAVLLEQLITFLAQRILFLPCISTLGFRQRICWTVTIVFLYQGQGRMIQAYRERPGLSRKACDIPLADERSIYRGIQEAIEKLVKLNEK